MPSQTFAYTGGWQKFTVPAGVKILDVTLKGGGSGDRQGGKVSGRIRVEGGDVFHILVGRRGFAASGSVGGEPCFGGGGRGGTGTGGRAGGRGGGGASAIRKNTRDGRIIAVAGGAGGKSGDDGQGGRGGNDIGEIGAAGSAGAGTTQAATGGTQNQQGMGGTSTAGSGYDGRNGEAARLGRGGRGGGLSTNAPAHGGGGGGGGYWPGGGGQASKPGSHPGGGGAGGSNFTGGLYSVTAQRGGGGTDHGEVKITWEAPGGNTPPSPPTGITINGQAISDELPTKATNSVVLKGVPDDPDAGQSVRLLVRISKDKQFGSFASFTGTWDAQEKKDRVDITGLEQDTLYYVRIYTQDHNKKVSLNYRSTSFWTNRRPLPPTLTQPAENSQVPSDLNLTFIWTHNDADPDDPQGAFEMRYRRAGTATTPPGDWVTTDKVVSSFPQWVIDAHTFKGNKHYEWMVRTWDAQDRRGEWSDPNSFYVTAQATPPTLLYPIKNEAVAAVEETVFRWKFLSPNQEAVQDKADLRYRAIGALDWTIINGTIETPGSDWEYAVAGGTFTPGYRYEWQARTHSSLGAVSDWSDSETFWATFTSTLVDEDLLASGTPQEMLGHGDNRVFVYDRGGQTIRGEITNITQIKWSRTRDDISSVALFLDEWDRATKEFLGSLRCWQHELVIFRDGVRVWEGPITRISGNPYRLEVDAKDVMAYVYRRIMRQGYNDSYRIINGRQIGLPSVVTRARQIIMNALAYDDPNILSYLTTVTFWDDAQSSRVVKDYSRTAWEEIDDLAAHAGLDYTTVGRRIVLWDTHRPIGKLPLMQDGDFSDPPVVTEYGMSAANYFAVTNNNGVWGAATRVIDGDPGPTGWLEQLASSYNESEGTGNEATLTKAAKKRLEESLAKQAERNISNRWPTPLHVRIPDNSTLNPEINIGINQLVPGVWVPLRATGTIREVTQWQKLDSMTVTQTEQGEKITVVMSPAPNGGTEDPDSDYAMEEL